jgi:hypothetical protein
MLSTLSSILLMVKLFLVVLFNPYAKKVTTIIAIIPVIKFLVVFSSYLGVFSVYDFAED